jgi:hypothetical protein
VAERPTFQVLEGGEVDDGLEALTHEKLVERARRAIALNAGLTRDLEAAEADMRTLRASRNAYKGQVTRLMTPKAGGVELVESLLSYWRSRCHGPNSTVEIPVDGKRGDAVRATLKRLVEADKAPDLASPDKDKRAAALATAEQRAAEKIRQAIDGAARFPYREKYGNRHPEKRPGTHKSVDLTSILKDEVSLGKFVALVETDERRLAYKAQLYRELTTRPGMLALFASLDPSHGEIICAAVRWSQMQATV